MVSILPVQEERGRISYRAVAGDKRASGATAGAALDALAAQLPQDEVGTLVLIQHWGPDRFFGEAEVRRLGELMARLHAAREQGQALPSAEQAELDSLVEAELRASAARASALADEAGR
jgi:hypothetical protein